MLSTWEKSKAICLVLVGADFFFLSRQLRVGLGPWKMGSAQRLTTNQLKNNSVLLRHMGFCRLWLKEPWLLVGFWELIGYLTLAFSLCHLFASSVVREIR